MNSSRVLWAGSLSLILLAGCWSGEKKIHYIGDSNLEYYKGVATEIAYPDVRQALPREVADTVPPRTIYDRHHDEVWDVSLIEVLHMAMANNQVLRQRGTFLGLNNPLYAGDQANDSVYDVAIQETGVLFGNRGVEAALADFDAQFTANMLWGRDERVQNNPFSGAGLTPGRTLVNETAAWDAAIEKQFAYGGTFTVFNTVDYLGTNSPNVLFPSSYNSSVGAAYRHPLWAGSGAEFTRTAGPINPGFTGITGVSQGVVIARINSDITIADFELAVRNTLYDVELLYWDLYLAYRLYDTAIAARNSALRTWREAQARLEVGGFGTFKPADEAQARDQLFATRALAEQTLNDVYTTEVELRRLVGLPVNDCRIMRPADEPTTAQLCPDWHVALTEALTERPELRRQKWQIKSLELQLEAARSLTNPRLDFVSAYQVNGFGDQLFGESDDDEAGTVQGLDSSFETLTQGDQTSWTLGLELGIPIGFRQAKAQVRNYELRVAKARTILATQETEISHELATAVQNLAAAYTTAQSHFNRMIASRERLEAYEEELEVGTTTLDLVLRAQASLADAERDFYTSVVNYNQMIATLHLRKGTLLQENGVHLVEDAWTPKAYRDALRRAWARSHAIENPLLDTEPEPFAYPGGVKPLRALPVDEYIYGDGEHEHGTDGEPAKSAPAGEEYPDADDAGSPPPAPAAGDRLDLPADEDDGEPVTQNERRNSAVLTRRPTIG